MQIHSRLAFALLAAAAVAAAQPGGPFGRRPPNPFMTALDTDRDGTVSAEEISKAAGSLGSLDKDKDGALGEDETRMQFGPRGRESGAQAPDDMVNTLLSFDKNSDGKLEKSEVPERMQGLFARGDQNNDGTLSSDELKALAGRQQQQQDPARRGMPMDPIRGALDADRDGVISRAELQQAPVALAKLDRNHDGALTEDEVRPMGGPGGRGGPRGNPAEMYKHMLEENDSNKDGKLAVSELPDRMREFIGRADTNGDGFISQEEMASMRRPGGRGER